MRRGVYPLRYLVNVSISGFCLRFTSSPHHYILASDHFICKRRGSAHLLQAVKQASEKQVHLFHMLGFPKEAELLAMQMFVILLLDFSPSATLKTVCGGCLQRFFSSSHFCRESFWLRGPGKPGHFIDLPFLSVFRVVKSRFRWMPPSHHILHLGLNGLFSIYF